MNLPQVDFVLCISSIVNQHMCDTSLYHLKLLIILNLLIRFTIMIPDSHFRFMIQFTILRTGVDNGCECAGFEQPIMVCCGTGGPPLNYDSRISCGQTTTLNGTVVTANGCSNSSKYVNWDGIHYTEAANKYVSSQILTGKFSDPPLPQKLTSDSISRHIIF